MKLIDAKDWKAVHFKDRTILRSDRNLYPEADWWALVSTVDVEPMKEPGHFKVVSQGFTCFCQGKQRLSKQPRKPECHRFQTE